MGDLEAKHQSSHLALLSYAFLYIICYLHNAMMPIPFQDLPLGLKTSHLLVSHCTMLRELTLM